MSVCQTERERIAISKLASDLNIIMYYRIILPFFCWVGYVGLMMYVVIG